MIDGRRECLGDQLVALIEEQPVLHEIADVEQLQHLGLIAVGAPLGVCAEPHVLGTHDQVRGAGRAGARAYAQALRAGEDRVVSERAGEQVGLADEVGDELVRRPPVHLERRAELQ